MSGAVVPDPDPVLDATLSALAHPTRRRIVDRLSEGEATVSELAEPFDVSLPAVSKHLTVLEEAGLVARTRRGRRHVLRLRAGPLGATAAWLETTRRTWEARLDRLERLLQEDDADGEDGEDPDGA